MAKIGFIGTGEIAAAQVSALSGQGHEILVSERNPEVAAELASAHEEVRIAPNQAVLDGADIVILCLMATTARDVLPALNFRADHQVVSVMVDVGLSELAELCTPASSFTITIPLPFIARGNCPLPVYPDNGVLRDLFGEANPIIPLADEAAMNPHFAASAMCSVIFSQLSTASDWLANHTGDATGAEIYVASLIGGYLADTPKDGADRLGAAIASLNTDGGLNQTLREHMRSAGANDALTAGLDGFTDRLGLVKRK
ncbi:MAG: NAD(P)-binding domain-containing protein [Pikeienuella sp.]